MIRVEKFGVLVIASGGLVVFLIQNFIWAGTDQEKMDRSIDYQTQQVYLTESLYGYFGEIRRSGTYASISLSTGDKAADLDYWGNVQNYYYQLSNILRVLEHLGRLSSVVIRDTDGMLEIAMRRMSQEEQREVVDSYQSFYEKSKRFEARKQKITEFKDELSSFLEGMSRQSFEGEPDYPVEHYAQAAALIGRLYSDEGLFLAHGTDPFDFVREFAKASSEVTHSYSAMLDRYNESANFKSSVKDAVSALFILLAAYFSFRKEVEK